MRRSAPPEHTPPPVVLLVTPESRAATEEDPPAPRRWGWVAGLAVVALLGIGALIGAGDASPVRPDARSQELSTVGSLTTVASRHRRASVQMDNQAPLVDGSIVEVTGTGFPGDAEVGLRQCVGRRVCVHLEPVEVSGASGTYRSSFRTDQAGNFSARVSLRRHVILPGEDAPADCSDVTGRNGCDLVTVIYFTGQSSYPPSIPLRFTGGGQPPQRPVVIADATSGLSDSQRIDMAGLGFRPGTTVRPVMCDAATGTGCEPLGVEGPAVVGDDSTVMVRVVMNERIRDLDCRAPRTCSITLLPEQSGGRAAPAGLPVSFIE